MKIIFVGDLNTYGRSYGRLLTLKSLNHNVFPLSHSKISNDGLIQKPSLLYRLSNKAMMPIDQTNVNKLILKILNENNIDIVWIENGITILPNTLKNIKNLFPSVKLISLSEDDMFQRHNQSLWYLKGLKFYDFVFTTKNFNIEELKKLGAKKTYLFLDSFDQRYHKPMLLNDIEKKLYITDVSAIGAFEKERAASLMYIAKNGIKVSVWGSGWDVMEKQHRLLKIKNQFLYGESYTKAIVGSKINLNFLRKINRDTITSRSVEIPACGGFMLSERTKRHTDTFREGFEAEFFSDNEEMVNKIKYYLENEKDRKKIAEKGYYKCIKGYLSMKSQLKKIIAIINI